MQPQFEGIDAVYKSKAETHRKPAKTFLITSNPILHTLLTGANKS